jgi:hypothetical protein
MIYITTFRKETKIVDMTEIPSKSCPRVLANWKPVRFGRSRLQRHTDYETVRPMETTTRTQGSLLEPREVNSLNVML